MFRVFHRFACAMFVLVLFRAAVVDGANTLDWNTRQDRVTADIQSLPAMSVLEGISNLTGWRVYVESNTTFSVSTKFKDLPSGEALRLLLGQVNFALVPETNAAPRLYVFRSSQRNATLLVAPADINAHSSATNKAIGNQLVVTLKPGAKIDDLARLLGARVTGRMDALNTYRLEFDSEDAAQKARQSLSTNPDVESVDSNFTIDQPFPAQQLNANLASDFNLKVKDSSGDCQVVIGLIDSAVNSLGKPLDSFLLPGISVAGDAPKTAGLTHGPAMAETILRSVQATSGDSSSVKILPVDVYGSSPTTSTFDVAQGIYRAVNAGANVINLSLGGSGDSTVLHKLIQDASQKGVIFFGAAGNEPVTTPTYPAAYPEVIAVTAGDRNGQVAAYANRGSFVDVITPGTSVVPYNGQSYVVSGTSAATAYASGIAAGLADANRVCPPEVVSAIRSKLAANLSGK